MRKLTGVLLLLLLSVVLVACGTGDDEAEPTEAPDTSQRAQTVEETPEATATTAVSDDDEDAASPAAGISTPESALATPNLVSEATPDDVAATPGATPIASPVTGATPMASPAGMIVPPVTAASSPPALLELTGTVMLDGRPNEAYVITEVGCVGLGQYAGLQAGRQVVVRNEDGTIISVTTLEATDADGCAWEFVVAVPESDFYSVSVPMVFEQVFPKAQVNENNGEIEIALP